MKLIENGIIPIYQSEKGNKVVNARELHQGLDIGRDFSNWIKDRIEKYGFIEGSDFSPILAKTSEQGGRPAIEYALTIDCAKEIAMVENNEKGKLIRKYFIEVEKRLITQKPESVLDVLEYMVKSLRDQEQQIKEISSTVVAIREAVTYRPDTWRDDVNRLFNRIAAKTGTNTAYETVRKELYKELESRAHCDLQRRLDNYISILLKQGANKTALNKANKLDVIEQDPKLKEIFFGITKEALIRYGCEKAS